MSSVRRYTSYRIITEDVEFPYETKFLRRNAWEQAEIIIQRFVETAKYTAYLSLFAPKIVELELRSIHPFSKIDNNNQFPCFPELRILKILNCCSESLRPFLKCKQLTTLCLLNLKQSTLSESSDLEMMIPKLFNRQKKLEQLELNGSLSDFAFKYVECSQRAINIKKLVVEHPASNKAQMNFRKFVVKSGSTIESLHLTNWPSTSTIYHIWHDLPILKEFHQICLRAEKVEFDELHRETMKLAKKQTIEKLTLVFTNTDPEEVPLEWITPILNASPRIINLVIQPISDAIVNYIRDQQYMSQLFPYYDRNKSKTQLWTRYGRDHELFKDFMTDDSGSEGESEHRLPGNVALNVREADSIDEVDSDLMYLSDGLSGFIDDDLSGFIDDDLLGFSADLDDEAYFTPPMDHSSPIENFSPIDDRISDEDYVEDESDEDESSSEE